MKGSYPRPYYPYSPLPRPPPAPAASEPSLPFFELRLFRATGRRDSAPGYLDSLVSTLPYSPAEFFVYPAGPLAAKLFFRRAAEALAGVVFLWRRRLDGAHLLNPRVISPSFSGHDRAEEAERVLVLFADHARGLLKGKALEKCAKRIEEVGAEIAAVRKSLRQQNSWKRYNELRAKRRQLETEKEQLKAKMEEFLAAIRCVLAHLGEREVDDGQGKVEDDLELFKFGDEWDWSRIHSVLLRECRRLEEGLPIYACRRNILRAISENQVIVLVGETGSGKSTQLVQFLADSGLATKGSIVCTQPRKIAATSLAQRVAEESNGCYEDYFVISYPNNFSSQDFGSKVIFMTDHCLLQHYMNEKSLDDISYIIIDEVHERSLNTDLLLALLKRTLLQHFDLRLVIMSATADARKISDYFHGCSTFYVTGRNFPVEIKYIPDISAEASYAPFLKNFSGTCASYVSDVVKMVSVIHTTEQDGGILAFLTSQMEVEWACEKFTDPLAVVLPMHGKLSCEEQNRVFQNYPGKRKVIFSTNVAETSLTIQGVKYVVDSGMVKESKFDSISGMNMLKVCRTSKSSANQRSGRAGRTEPGKCYRMYSLHDFQSMQMHQEPEIRKVHLGIACLNILALGIKNVKEFDFIDAPSPCAIDTAMQNLTQLGAIIHENGIPELTETGRCLVKLGIEPRLGKILLECFDYGLKKEGVVLAAVMANSSSIFCRVGNDEEKCKADCLRLPFCHRDGDLFTLLSVYKEWECGHESRKQWCWQNSINAKSMRRCWDTIRELEMCLQYELNIIIPNYWLWNPHEPTEYDRSLKKVILSSLADNAAMYSGSDRLGYRVALTGEYLPLHPSCSLLVYSKRPSWVIFGEILLLSRQYLVCVTAVDTECLYRLQPPLFDISQLESEKLQMNVISGVGNNLIRRLCGRSNHNLHCLVSQIQQVCMDNNISVDVDFDKREIHLLAKEKDMDKVCFIVNDALRCEAHWLRDECIEKCVYHGGLGSSPSVALFGSGAEIKHLELEKRYLTVEILHPKANELNDKELLKIADKCGNGIASFYRHSGNGQEGLESNKWGKVTFLSPEAAENAVVKMNEVELQGSLLKVLPVGPWNQKVSRFPAIRAKVCWPRRPSKGVALITCAQGDAEYIVQDCYSLIIGDRYVNCQPSVKHTNRVFVSGIPKDVTEQEIYDAFLSATNRRIFGVCLLRGEAINNLPTSTYAEALSKEVAPFMLNRSLASCNFQVEVLNYETKDYMMRATITFDGSLHMEATNALDHIQGKVLPCCLPWQKIQCQRIFSSSVSCPARVYIVIKDQLNHILEGFKHRKGVSYRRDKNENGTFRITLTADSPKAIADARKPLEGLMKGKIISHRSLSPAVLQLLSSQEGFTLMKDVERSTKTYILCDRHNQLSVKIFGPQERLAAAEEKLTQKLLSFHENRPLDIRLRGRNLPHNLMKEVAQRFGPDLHGLREKVPGINMLLRTRTHILSVRGTKEMKQSVQEVICELALSLGSSDLASKPSDDEGTCAICLCEVDEPYRLEECGHSFCRNCLIDHCESAIRSREGFPLCCSKEKCQKPLLLVDLRALLSTDKLEDLFRASLVSFVASSGGAYRFCPTPDCPSVYAVSMQHEAAKAFFCGACGAETCTKCHLEFHPFVTCELYREFKDDPDLSLQEWRKGKAHVKDCPSCGHTIEKVEGCNHIECRCGRHVCWVCLESFNCSDECYGHLRSVHHSIV
ncbi:ATP-dependent RNA helicase DEAH12, chloroplastic-like [Typha latifolia]|uniref:ATP-dependent RNA helicase DEAH12, chloroplastic-like n=1 Tax=Typha latifolia TaxID=4733 RepID=UPI003C30AA6D